jgi:hypothetical protein
VRFIREKRFPVAQLEALLRDSLKELLSDNKRRKIPRK